MTSDNPDTLSTSESVPVLSADRMGLERRALRTLLRRRDTSQTPHRRITPAMRSDLLGWAAALPDEELLDMHGMGHVLLRWIREHQPRSADQATADEFQAPTRSTFSEVIKRTGWRVELFWNSGGGWFTARLVSLYDRQGIRSYSGGFLVPFDDPIGASGGTPRDAMAALAEAVLEWA